MAIDTAKKRASALGVGLVFCTLVIPSGTIAQTEQQTIAHSYSGILAEAPVIVTQDCIFATESIIDPSETAGDGVIVSRETASDSIITEFIASNSFITGSIATESIINPDIAGDGIIDDEPTAGTGDLC